MYLNTRSKELNDLRVRDLVRIKPLKSTERHKVVVLVIVE